jgi:uncharacterized repeat protein (TIGR04138 family)
MAQQVCVNWDEVAQNVGPYPPEAFQFVREGLSYTAEHIHGNREAIPETRRHISGQQLCMGLRDFAIEQYGLLAPTVLAHWHIHRTDDFGRIVFRMIEKGLMSKTDDDTFEDFRRVYDFTEAFNRNELISFLVEEIASA